MRARLIADIDAARRTERPNKGKRKINCSRIFRWPASFGDRASSIRRYGTCRIISCLLLRARARIGVSPAHIILVRGRISLRARAQKFALRLASLVASGMIRYSQRARVDFYDITALALRDFHCQIPALYRVMALSGRFHLSALPRRPAMTHLT